MSIEINLYSLTVGRLKIIILLYRNLTNHFFFFFFKLNRYKFHVRIIECTIDIAFIYLRVS